MVSEQGFRCAIAVKRYSTPLFDYDDGGFPIPGTQLDLAEGWFATYVSIEAVLLV